MPAVNSHAEPEFADRAAGVAVPLREAFHRLYDDLSIGESKSGGRSLSQGIHPSIRSRLTRALETENELASLYRMPGPDGLRRVVKAAQRAGLDAEVLAECESRITDYERFFVDEDISRETLHSMLAGHLFEVRDAVMRSSAQASFRARCGITGYYAECLVLSLLVFPGSVEGHCNIAVLRGCLGWRRLRKDAWFMAHGYQVRSDDIGDISRHTDLDGVPIQELAGAPLLEPYCSTPLPVFEAVSMPHGRNYYLKSEDVGVRSLTDFFVGEILWDSQLAVRTETATHARESIVMSTPSKQMVFDVLIHRDVWAGSSPTIECFNIVPQGIVTEGNHRLRQNDRIEIDVANRKLAPGLREVGCAAAKNYREVVQSSVSRLGYSMRDFHGYRSEMAYPLYGSQLSYRFELPEL